VTWLVSSRIFFVGAAATKPDRKKFKVYDEEEDEVSVWVVKDQNNLDGQLERKGVELYLDDDAAVEVSQFDDIIPNDDSELRDWQTHRYRSRPTKLARAGIW